MSEKPLPKLGKAAPRHDSRNLMLGKYLTTEFPNPPAAVDYAQKVRQPWGMMLNDRLGNCTCAAAGHMILQWTANAGVAVVPPDDSILSAYEGITGYNPANPDSDQGAVELDVLNYWRQTGIAGHKIGAFAAIHPWNRAEVRAAVWLFGGLYIGVALPASAQGASVWDVPPYGCTGAGTPGSWGGHAVEVVAYDADGLTVITWGAPMKVTWQFWDAYVDEAYAILSNDFLVGGIATPAGFDLAALTNDLQAVTA